ncbi:PREDICTED: RNA exonuclease 1 homolog [Camelina sativa]|uniref:RNA exonuclease 1 homolog n=1 Tax=Camelina sativa TaxID=90675 RepID=A0ABM0W5A5_CAMSA|nr:PREDICTED: RNA exonuclease 1 homolog [Camelina sativa]
MDPSLSISSDPHHHHHPPQFTPFPAFPTSHPFASGSGAVPALNHPQHPLVSNPYMNNNNNNNNHVFQPQPQTQIPQPLMATNPNHPPYSEMICAAIAALNEPDGSSKMAISRYIERCHSGLPAAHPALLTHSLKTLKNSGVLAMVKKSYKFAGSSAQPESAAVAAAAAAQGLDVPRSEIFPQVNNTVNDPMSASASGSASQPQKRGRGRPPKPKPEAQAQPLQAIQPNQVQSNGQQIWQQAPRPTEAVPVAVTESAKRGPGRPRKNGASAPAVAPIVQASVMAGIMKRRGRPPGRRAAGRQRKPKSVSATASVYPYVANGARRRGRPRRIVDPSSSVTVAPVSGQNVAAVVAPGMKRGRGRPPKIGGVISRLMKPIRGRGRPVGRPRKIATSVTTGTQDSGELKRKFDVFQEKVKEIVKVLKDGVTSDDPAVVQAIKDLEGLTVTETVEPPQAMEEVQAEPLETSAPETEAQTEAAETQGGQEQGQEREGGEAQTETETQTQTEAEAMQEALF